MSDVLPVSKEAANKLAQIMQQQQVTASQKQTIAQLEEKLQSQIQAVVFEDMAEMGLKPSKWTLRQNEKGLLEYVRKEEVKLEVVKEEVEEPQVTEESKEEEKQAEAVSA